MHIDRYFIYIMGSLLSTLLIFGLTNCQSPSRHLPTAQEIIDASILAHGGEAYDQLDLSFAFRDKMYRITRNGGSFRYERSFEKDGKQVVDVLENGDFSRNIDGVEVAVVDSMARKYANSVNSVCYFVLLPQPLNDPATTKKLLGRSEINGINYYKVQVQFLEEGGGEDFEDTYVYWIHPGTFQLDFLAYDYKTNGGGLRFRKAYNPQVAQGIRIQDYVNYKADHKTYKVDETDQLFLTGKLEELSRIETRPLAQ